MLAVYLGKSKAGLHLCQAALHMCVCVKGKRPDRDPGDIGACERLKTLAQGLRFRV